MRSKHSDTTAREQQIREQTHKTKLISPTSTVQTRPDVQQSYEFIIIAVIHIIFSLFILGRFTINNASLIREVYYTLIVTSNETFTEIPSFFETIR